MCVCVFVCAPMRRIPVAPSAADEARTATDVVRRPRYRYIPMRPRGAARSEIRVHAPLAFATADGGGAASVPPAPRRRADRRRLMVQNPGAFQIIIERHMHGGRR